jgi:hypothetical protein
VASGAVVAPTSRDLDLLGYWIFGFTVSDEEGFWRAVCGK